MAVQVNDSPPVAPGDLQHLARTQPVVATGVLVVNVSAAGDGWLARIATRV